MARKYISVSNRLHKALQVYAKHSDSNLKSAAEHLIDLGLRYEREAHQKPENEKIFDQRLPEFQYTISRSARTYLAVSIQVYEKVKSYAYKKKLSIIEGTWRLLSIGMQYSLGGNPREDPRFSAAMKVVSMIEKHLKENRGLPVEKYLTAEGKSNLEERVIKILQRQERSGTGRVFQKTKINDTTINYIRMMEGYYMTILQGAQRRIEKLEKRNKILESQIVQRDKLFKQQEADSGDKVDIASQGDASRNVVQNEWPSLE